MSLLLSAMETFTKITKATVPDGYGGFSTVWEDGDEIQAAVMYDNSTQARIAGVQGVTSLYTITTSKAVVLLFHDVLRRESDGKIFRVTSDGTDKKTPPAAGLDMRQVSAEEWRLTNGVDDGQSSSAP